MSTIHTRVESARGCGYRKPGGLYLVSGRLASPCGKLPIPLTVCPCCSTGIKPARGFTWIGNALIQSATCSICENGCIPFDGSVERFGLLWVGEKFYKTPQEFRKEASAQGISRRISQVPREFKVGETWILLAHRNAIEKSIINKPNDSKEPEYIAAIFSAFLPERIEYVVKGDETEEELLAMEKRGLTLVKVIKDTEQQMQLTDLGSES